MKLSIIKYGRSLGEECIVEILREPDGSPVIVTVRPLLPPHNEVPEKHRLDEHLDERDRVEGVRYGDVVDQVLDHSSRGCNVSQDEDECPDEQAPLHPSHLPKRGAEGKKYRCEEESPQDLGRNEQGLDVWARGIPEENKRIGRRRVEDPGPKDALGDDPGQNIGQDLEYHHAERER